MGKAIKYLFILFLTIFSCIGQHILAACDCDENHPVGSQCRSECSNGGQNNGGDGGQNGGTNNCDCSIPHHTGEQCRQICNNGGGEGGQNEGGNDGGGENGGDEGGDGGQINMDNMGMTINPGCLTNGQCKFNIYKGLGIRKSNENPTVMDFAKDVVLAATTFIGTVITFVLVLSGVLYAINSISGKSTEMAKKGIINSALGLLLVTGAYTIIRLIQFLATAGS